MRTTLILGALLALAGCADNPFGAAFEPRAPQPVAEAPVPQTPEEARAHLLGLVRAEQAIGTEIGNLGPEEMAWVNRICLAAALYPSRYNEASRTACALALEVGTPQQGVAVP
jgi:hypothetical protein